MHKIIKHNKMITEKNKAAPPTGPATIGMDDLTLLELLSVEFPV